MTAEDFTAACERCGWSPQRLAAMCGWRRDAGTDWATGRVKVPRDVAKWLAMKARQMERNPPPQREDS